MTGAYPCEHVDAIFRRLSARGTTPEELARSAALVELFVRLRDGGLLATYSHELVGIIGPEWYEETSR